jgi:hypothetical protein
VYHGYIVIPTVAELLRALQEAEIRQIEKAGILHAPTIGEMYEGLTSSILDKAIPPKLVCGLYQAFVENGSGMQSGQIDCKRGLCALALIQNALRAEEYVRHTAGGHGKMCCSPGP